MEINRPLFLYSSNKNRMHDAVSSARVDAPAVMNNKLEALKVLANSILSEVASLERDREIVSHTNVDLSMEVERFEIDLIRCALTRTGGRQRRAAALLGIKPTTLHAKMKRYGMTTTAEQLEEAFDALDEKPN
ncbi:MAG: helix-turn-helix domain-containing protein [Acidobacteriota bacterium]